MAVIDKATSVNVDALVEEHLYLVQHLVNQLASRYPRHVDRSELWSAGAAGLVDAAQRFDTAAGVPFARYASIRIRGAIIDSTRSRDWATRSLRRRARELQAVERSLEQELSRSPSREELALASEMTVEEIEQCQRGVERSTLLQLDQPVTDSSSGVQDTLQSLLVESDPGTLPQDAAEQRELVGTLRIAVENLDDVHREVIVRHFFGDDLLQDIAADLGVTEARVSQIRSEAINAIRAYLGTEFDGVPDVPESAPGRRRRAAYLSNMQEHTSWRERFDAPAPRTAVSA
ncbi:MAG: RNA polymerase sigma factor for flagellar operon FliA [Myxococcota bacterium]|jgi:RNA polymerase sigma factor for flagellar operon FliA